MMKCWRDIQKSDINNEKVIVSLQELEILKRFGVCINCEDTHIVKARTNRLKCQDCEIEWSIRRGSILEDSKVPLKKILLLYHLYIDGISSHKASIIAKVNKNTSHKFYKEFKKI